MTTLFACRGQLHRVVRTGFAMALGLVVIAAVLGTGPAYALNIEPLWSVNADMVMEGAAMTVDLDGDGDDEALTAAYENIIVVDGTGKELWRYDAPGRYMTCPAVLERAGQSPLIFAGDGTGEFACLDGAGQKVWEAQINSVACSSPVLADLDGNGAFEVIQGDKSGVIHVWDALAGTPVWSTQVEGECSCPAVGDLDGDGDLEIVIATGVGKVFAINGPDDVLWEFAVGGTSPDWATSSPILFGHSSGEVCVAAASRQGRFFCLDSKGNLRWDRATRGPIASTISAADLDMNGRVDLFVVTQLGALYRFDEEGRVLWDIDTQGRSLASGAIIDMDGDGTLEYVLCTQRGTLLIFGTDGTLLFTHQFDNRTINVTPVFGDLQKDRPGLEFVITGGESGQMFCFGTSAPKNTAAPWRTYRADNHLTAGWFGLIESDEVCMVPENLDWDSLLVGQAVRFRVENPKARGRSFLNAQATCIRPDGSRQTAVGKIVGRRGLLEMPVSIPAPGPYAFEWLLTDEAGQTMASGSRDLTLHPYLDDQAVAKRAALALREAMGEAGGAAANKGMLGALNQEAIGIEQEANALLSKQAAAPGASPGFVEQLDARTAALNTRAKRALALAKVARSIQAHAPGSQVMAFEGLTWENRGVDEQLPEKVAIPLQIARRCVVGERESISIKLLNVTVDPLAMKARVEAAAGAPSVVVNEVKPVPTNQGTTAWDPIVPLGDGAVTIPSLEAREFWLDIDASGVAPGTYPMRAVFSGGPSETMAEISVEVLPFQMAGPDAMRLCCWASYNEDTMKDLLAHGNTVFVCSLPTAQVVEGDPPTIAIDFTALDEYLAPLEGHDVFLLMSGAPALGVAMEEEAYVPRLAAYLDQLFAHLAEKGIDEKHVALYPHDEPGGHGWDTVHHYVEFGRQGLKAHPGLQFYVNGGGDLAMYEALNEVASVWCPGFFMLAEESPQMNFLRSTGKTLWSYDCGYSYARPIGANTKTINIAAQYRLAAVFTVGFGGDGLGYWCYNVGPSMWDAIPDEYPLVYQKEDEPPTSSRRWEAVREGMEDAWILIALKAKLEDASVPEPAKQAIRALLDGTVADISDRAYGEVQLGVARYVLDDSYNDETVQRLRDEMMDCVAMLAE